MAESPKSPKSAPGDDSAIAEIQAGAKWLIAALGAIAAILVAGVSLSDLGSVGWPRNAIAVVGVLVATWAVMHLLHLVLDVLIAEPVRLAELVDEPAEKFGLALLSPAEAPGDLFTETPELIDQAQDAYAAWAETSFNDVARQQKYLAADAKAKQWSLAGKRAVSRLRLLRLQEAFKKFRDQVALNGTVIVVGVAVAAWALTGSKMEDLTIGSVQQTPTNVVVEFKDVDFSGEVPDYAEDATEDCVNADTAHSAVALGVEGQTFTLALVKSDECPAVVVTVDASEATVALPPASE